MGRAYPELFVGALEGSSVWGKAPSLLGRLLFDLYSWEPASERLQLEALIWRLAWGSGEGAEMNPFCSLFPGVLLSHSIWTS